MVQARKMNKIIQVNASVTLLQAKNSLLNATVVENNDSLLVIDTLLLPKDSKELYEFCLTKNKPIKYIINTHWHSDHCYGNRFFDHFNPIIIAHKLFWNTIEKEKNIIAPEKANIINKKLLRLPHITFSKDLELPEFNLVITHAPGHSDDSTRIYSQLYDIYWTGDNVLNSNDNRIAIPYFYWGNPQELLSELRSLAKKKPNIIIPGHGLPCDYHKLDRDVSYLENLLLSFSKLSSSCSNQKLPSLIECYPTQENDSFWVEKMHSLNLERLGGSSFSALALLS